MKRVAVLLLLVGLIFSAGPKAQAVTTTLIDFEAFLPETLLGTQLRTSQGVTFDPPVIVLECFVTTCGTAASGSNVATGRNNGEFERFPFTADFTAPQSQAYLRVKSNRSYDPPREITATLVATDIQPGEPFDLQSDSRTITFQSDAGWQLLEVFGRFGLSIDRIRLSGGESDAGFDTNFLVVDDLFFAGEAPPPVPEDTVPPTVQILAPSPGTTITEGTRGGSYVEVEVRVQEDQDLSSVSVRVEHLASSEQAGKMEFCGRTDSLDRSPCPSSPPIVYERSVRVGLSLPGGLEEGTYEVRVTACDVVAENCTTATRFFTLDFPEPPPDIVSPFYFEVNQAVQGRLGTAHLGRVEDYPSSVRIVPGKDTVVRVYLMADGAPRPAFTGCLIIRLTRRDGSSALETLSPNVGAAAITVPQDPVDPVARDDLLLGMRADPTQTVNFVIPGTFLEDADSMQLLLWERRASGSCLPLSGLGDGGVDVDFSRPVRLGLNVVLAVGSGAPGSVTGAVVDDIIVPYLERAFPVSEVRVLSRRSLVIVPAVSWLPPFFGECFNALHQVWVAFGDEDAPARFPASEPDPHFTSTLGYFPVGAFDDCAGYAYIGDPDDDDERLGATAITEPWGDVAAQEIGHALSLIHAGNAHDECDGGDCERDWPYPHGTVGEGRFIGNFGVIPSAVVPPGPLGFGQWAVSLVDPCPTLDLSQRDPCMLADNQQMHDFMSYGQNAAPPGSTLMTLAGAWVSPITYNRIYAAICCRVAAAGIAAGSIAGELLEPVERVDALLIDGVVQEDGTAQLLPVFRKRMSRARVENVRPGPFTLELRDEAGNLLLQRSFDVKDVGGRDGQERISSIRQAVPYMEGLHRVIVREGDRTIMDETASPNPPQVRVTSPNGGEVLQSGTHTITWEASDADGGPLRFLVQYSPDGGQSWQGIGLAASGNPYEVELIIGEQVPGDQAIIRVTASDGMNTAIDQSDCPFSLGPNAGTPVECEPPVPTATVTARPTPTPTPTATATPRATPTPALPKALGDVNDDGFVNAIDATLVLQLGAGLIVALLNTASADVNCDDLINALDVALILQFGAGFLAALPGCP